MVSCFFPACAHSLSFTSGGTEELITETLGRVGQVEGFRMVYDKETGRPKGYGFATFADADAAASAVRNLNNYELMGRQIKVDWSKDNGAGDNAPPDHAQDHTQNAYPPMNMNGHPPAQAQPVQQPGALGPLPPGVDLPPNLTCADAISRTLSTLPPPQLLDILSQMKGLVMTDPAKATELLRQAPQLAYAIFQSLLLLHLVDGSVLGSLIENSAAPAPVAQPPPVQQPPQHVAPPPMSYPGYPPQVPTPQPHMQQPYAQPPSVQPQQNPYGHPPQPPNPYAQPPQAQAQPQAQPAMDQSAMYAQVMALKPEQIAQLAPEQQQQILQLRQFIMAGVRP